MHFNLKNLEPRNRYKLLTGVIVPRPIALVTTLDLEGRVNAAPYSFFNAIGSDPPIGQSGFRRNHGGDEHDRHGLSRGCQ
jgi:flavin reductase (DIM6/NTAB) family NADH-FMN oxidoreductase RutF